MSSEPIRLALLGATGRMGGALARLASTDRRFRITAAVASVGVGRSLGEVHGVAGLAVTVQPKLSPEAAFDVLIDFSRPQALVEALDACVERGAALVTGTTGLDAGQQAQVDEAARRIAVCQAANFSVGVNLCLALARTAARSLGEDWDAEIVEAHHRHKVDAPSGTALALGREIADARGRELPADGVFARHGHTGERPRGSIGFAVVRGGDVVGEHRVLLLGEGERVEIAHVATSRDIFAAGALRAAAWLHGRPPGHYGMAQVLGLAAAG